MNDHPEDQAAPVPDKGHEVMETLAGFGIDRDTLRSIMEPMIVDVITSQTPKLLAELPNMLDKMLTAKMDQLTASLAGQIDGRVKAIVGAAASAGQTNGAAAPAAALGGAGGNDMVASLLGLVLKKVMGPPAGDATGGAQLQGVLNYANSMNTIMTQVLDPVMSLYNRGATDERARMTALSKMGIEVPLGETPPPPEPLTVKASVDNRPVAAELHQVDNVASAVAARIKLS